MKALKPYLCCLLLIACTCTDSLLRYPLITGGIPTDWQDESTVIVSDSLNIELKKAGQKNIIAQTQVTWYKINKTTANDLQKYFLRYYTYLEDAPIVAIRAFYNDGRSERIFNLKRYADLYDASNLYYHKLGYNLLFAEIPRYSAVTFLRIEVNRRIHKTNEYGTYIFRSEYPTLKKQITFIYPASCVPDYGIANNEQLRITTSSCADDNGNMVFSITCDSLKQLSRIYCKYPEAWYGGLYISFPPRGCRSISWKEMGNDILQEIADSLKNKDTLFLDSIAGGFKTQGEDSCIKAIFYFVRNSIRYYASGENAYGWIPRDPKSIFKNGYGDCKEMATIVAYLLTRAGSKAWPVLVSTEGFQYDERYPTQYTFDHYIACVEKSNGLRLFFDPTDKYSTWHSSCDNLIGQKVFILRKDSSCTDIIQPEPLYQNKIFTLSRIFQDSANNRWQIAGEVALKGECAELCIRNIKTRATVGQSTILRNWLEDNLAITPLTTDSRVVSEDSLLISFSADASRCILQSTAEGITLAVPAICTPGYEQCDLSYEGDRYLRRVEQTDCWIIPEKFRNADFIRLDSPYGTGDWSLKNGMITRSYRCDFTRIGTTQRDSLRTFFAQRNRFSNGIMWSQKQ